MRLNPIKRAKTEDNQPTSITSSNNSSALVEKGKKEEKILTATYIIGVFIAIIIILLMTILRKVALGDKMIANMTTEPQNRSNYAYTQKTDAN